MGTSLKDFDAILEGAKKQLEELENMASRTDQAKEESGKKEDEPMLFTLTPEELESRLKGIMPSSSTEGQGSGQGATPENAMQVEDYVKRNGPLEQDTVGEEEVIKSVQMISPEDVEQRLVTNQPAAGNTVETQEADRKLPAIADPVSLKTVTPPPVGEMNQDLKISCADKSVTFASLSGAKSDESNQRFDTSSVIIEPSNTTPCLNQSNAPALTRGPIQMDSFETAASPSAVSSVATAQVEPPSISSSISPSEPQSSLASSNPSTDISNVSSSPLKKKSSMIKKIFKKKKNQNR